MRCFGCDRVLDAASNTIGESMPKPGNITVCLDCGHIMVFGDNLQLRNPNDQEILEIAGDKDLLLVQQARDWVMKNNKGRP
jgi:hypothetical protein